MRHIAQAITALFGGAGLFFAVVCQLGNVDNLTINFLRHLILLLKRCRHADKTARNVSYGCNNIPQRVLSFAHFFQALAGNRLTILSSLDCSAYLQAKIIYYILNAHGGLTRAPGQRPRSEEHTSELPVTSASRMPSSA